MVSSVEGVRTVKKSTDLNDCRIFTLTGPRRALVVIIIHRRDVIKSNMSSTGALDRENSRRRTCAKKEYGSTPGASVPKTKEMMCVIV